MEKPDLYVVARFLETIWIKGGGEMRKQELQMATRLNYTIYIKYLGFLKERGFINESPEGIVKITSKGVDAYNTLFNIIKDMMGKR